MPAAAAAGAAAVATVASGFAASPGLSALSFLDLLKIFFSLPLRLSSAFKAVLRVSRWLYEPTKRVSMM